MIDFRDLSAKLNDYASRGLTKIFGQTSFSGGPTDSGYSQEFWDNLANDVPNVKDYVEGQVETPARNIPEGGFKGSTMGASTSNNIPNIFRDYTDKQPFPDSLIPYVMESASMYGVDPNILASVIASESGGAGYQYDLPGSSGEMGIAQIMPDIFYRQAGFNSPDEYKQALTDPAFSIDQAAIILSDLLQQFDNDYYSAVASYNAGPSGFMSDYMEPGIMNPYARDTLGRIGVLEQYAPRELLEEYLVGNY